MDPLHEPQGLAIGIDVGGTSVKGCVVRPAAGETVGQLVRLPTPDPARIEDVVPVVAAVAARLTGSADAGTLPLGVALSGDVRDGRHTTGVNLHDSWVGAAALDLLEAATGRQLVILNDADAAAIGEVTLGAAAGVSGVVVVLTFGTGIGSGILLDGRLLPNTGLGQLPFQGRPAEQLISAVARERRGLTWSRWAADVSDYLDAIDLLLRPDLFVLGGGLVNGYREYGHLIRSTCPLVPATLGDRAGILGAAITALAARENPAGDAANP
jgi:polyphosphate glucokinase